MKIDLDIMEISAIQGEVVGALVKNDIFNSTDIKKMYDKAIKTNQIHKALRLEALFNANVILIEALHKEGYNAIELEDLK